MSYYNLDQTQAPQGMSTLKQVAVIVPCFVLGCVGALALTSPNAAVQNNVMRAIPTQAATAVAATAAAAMAANPAMAAASAVDTFDFRSVKSGYDIIYEARDLDLPQGTRDGLDQARDSATAKARIAESAARLDKVGVYPFLSLFLPYRDSRSVVSSCSNQSNPVCGATTFTL